MLAVGVCRLQMHIEASGSLKDKRQIVRSVTNRMRRRFNVAVAEIEDLDNWNLATIGIVCVSNDGAYSQALLNKAVNWLENERLDVEIGDFSIEVW
ncbi:MAG: DUF503 domain-containing protein [Anaerolineae bacterium]